MYLHQIPINYVTSSTPKQHFASFSVPLYSQDIAYPIPPSPLIEPNSDAHLLMLDMASKMLYEAYATVANSDGTYSAGVAVWFDLTAYSIRQDNGDNYVIADAAGLPIVPGLARFVEIQYGAINHAIRVAFDQLDNTYVWPAKAAAGASTHNANYPPHGQRFRLKATFDVSGYPSQEQIVLAALKKYGMVLADWNGGDSSLFDICAETNAGWTVDWDSFAAMNLGDFEAVDMAPVMVSVHSWQTTGGP